LCLQPAAIFDAERCCCAPAALVVGVAADADEDVPDPVPRLAPFVSNCSDSSALANIDVMVPLTSTAVVMRARGRMR
jgi:hypothetical protein